MRVISIFGGTGFIGTELISQLVKMPFKIQLFTRDKKKLSRIKQNSKLILIEFSQKSDLSSKLRGSDVIINLVGILHETRKVKFSIAHEN